MDIERCVLQFGNVLDKVDNLKLADGDNASSAPAATKSIPVPSKPTATDVQTIAPENGNGDRGNGNGNDRGGQAISSDRGNAGGAAPTSTSANTEEDISEADISLMRKILRTKLIQSKNNVEITRNDPNSPLYSIKSFEELRLYVSALDVTYSVT